MAKVEFEDPIASLTGSMTLLRKHFHCMASLTCTTFIRSASNFPYLQIVPLGKELFSALDLRTSSGLLTFD